MPNIRVTECRLIDIADVDAEHQELFRLCDGLQHALAAGASPSDIRSFVHVLVVHAAAHFAHEERDMHAARYPHQAWHQRQHRAARTKALAYERRLGTGDREAAGQLLQFLSRWMNDHIGIADRMLGAFLRNRRRVETALASH